MCFLVTFCTTQKVTIRFPFGKFEVLQTSNQRTQNNNFPLTRLNPFGTFLSESLPHSGQHAPRAFSPPLRLLETWSPCSRPFAILPVSAVSDAQKLATGNFLHVRACFLVTFCTTQKVTIRFPFGKFEVLQTSIQRTQITPSH